MQTKEVMFVKLRVLESRVVLSTATGIVVSVSAVGNITYIIESVMGRGDNRRFYLNGDGSIR